MPIISRLAQIGQAELGKATLYVTMENQEIGGDKAMLFDRTNVDVDFEFKIVGMQVRKKRVWVGCFVDDDMVSFKSDRL